MQNKKLKKLVLQKTTVQLLQEPKSREMMAGQAAATQPVLSCRKNCLTLIPLCVP